MSERVRCKTAFHPLNQPYNCLTQSVDRVPTAHYLQIAVISELVLDMAPCSVLCRCRRDMLALPPESGGPEGGYLAAAEAAVASRAAAAGSCVLAAGESLLPLPHVRALSFIDEADRSDISPGA
mmetsp:Transcript_35743/g.79542  ORF Transcript_35743/g.79542 Transcript_35743/m.79542 type:complete len:124 (+) Transcript_35743:1717-2088(+)